MCNNCIQYITRDRHVIRHASLAMTEFNEQNLKSDIFKAANKYKSSHLEFKDHVQNILVKFFNWKKNKLEEMKKQNIPSDEFKVSKGIFYDIAKSIQIDVGKNKKNKFYSSFLKYDEKEDFFDDKAHKQALDDTKNLTETDYKKVEDILKLCNSTEERDIILSISIGEKPQDFADRHQLAYSAVIQRRRRTLTKLMKRVSMSKNKSQDREAKNG